VPLKCVVEVFFVSVPDAGVSAELCTGRARARAGGGGGCGGGGSNHASNCPGALLRLLFGAKTMSIDTSSPVLLIPLQSADR
jgi:hypothetical protein